MIFDHYIDPVLFTLGPLPIRYYGLFVVLAILLSLGVWWFLLREDKEKFDTLFDLLVWLVVGGTIGARLGHVFFYEWEYYSQNLWQIFMIQNGGLASHGLTIGFIIAFFAFVKYKKIRISDYIDIVALGIPFIVIFVRLANFLNSEIVGRPTGGEWGVRFHLFEKDAILRHPTQLYEAALGLGILLIGLWSYHFFYKKRNIPFVSFNIFLFLYFATRFLVEYLKEYQTLDPSSVLTMGQYLSILPVLFSVGFFVYLWREQIKKPE